MRMQIYVPTARAEEHPLVGMSWGEFQSRVIAAAGGLTLTTAFGRWAGPGGQVLAEPIYIIEALVKSTPFTSREAKAVWDLYRAYAEQLLQRGEKEVLIVADNEPTFIR